MEEDEILEQKALHPEAEVLAHPECNQWVLKHADYIGSTKGIIQYATASEKEKFIICTEEGVGYELKRQNPEKQFYYPKSVPVCPNMKKVTLDKVLHVLQTGENEVHVDAELREKTKLPLERMLQLAK